MKALPYIEAVRQILLEKQPNGISDDVFFAYIILKTGRYNEFYSQPFSPETMLVGEDRLFVGWKCGYSKSQKPKEAINRSQFIEGLDSYYYTYQANIVDPNPGETFPAPYTLDQFISDCNRAGIELEWSDKAKEALR